MTSLAYGAGCTWWDALEKADTTRGTPCCPHCGSVCFQVHPSVWWIRVNRYAAQEPGHRELVQWMRGKCFRTLRDAREAFNKEQGK